MLFRARAHNARIVASELDREIAHHVHRATAMEQRGAVLIGAAGIAGALRLSDEVTMLTVIALALTFLAAAAGVIVMFPRRGDVLDMRRIGDASRTMTRDAFQERVDQTKLTILEADERWLTFRGHITRVGFICLASSIAVGLGAALLASSPEALIPTTAPTP